MSMYDDLTFGGNDEGINLTGVEAHALAKRMIARHLAANPEWLLWEDVPYIGEYAFVRLSEAVDSEVAALAVAARRFDEATGIDSADILSRAIG